MTRNKLTWAQRKGMLARSAEKQFINIKDAAEYLDVSRSTLRNWEKAGILIPRRHSVNAYRQYIKEDLDKLILAKKREQVVAEAKVNYGRKKNSPKVKKEDNQLFNIKQAAEFFGVSPSTIKNWIVEKNITVLANPDNNQAMIFRRELEEIFEKEKTKNSTKKKVASE